MALTFTGTGGLATRWGRIIAGINTAATNHAATLDSRVDSILSQFPADDRDTAFQLRLRWLLRLRWCGCRVAVRRLLRRWPRRVAVRRLGWRRGDGSLRVAERRMRAVVLRPVRIENGVGGMRRENVESRIVGKRHDAVSPPPPLFAVMHFVTG